MNCLLQVNREGKHKMIKKLVVKIIELIYPLTCPFCNKISKVGICEKCRVSIESVGENFCLSCGKPVYSTVEKEFCRECDGKTRTFDQGRSLYVHGGNVAAALYQFKYYNQRINGKIFGEELAEKFEAQIRKWEIEEIVPIPLHPLRERGRGFNQSEIMARVLGEKLDLPVNNQLVYRIKKTKPSKKLGKVDRVKNLAGAFGIPKSAKVAERILLIDDIYTTGITVSKVAKLLKRAGCKKVYFLTISIGRGY